MRLWNPHKRFFLSLLLVVAFLSSSVLSRPIFKDPLPEFDGSATADEDGVFRHDSIRNTRKRDSYSSNNFLRYEAVLIDGIVRLDDEFSVETIFCFETVLGSAIKVLKNPAATTSNAWNNETVLVGGPEWNCTQDAQGFPVAFSAKIISQLTQDTYLVSFVPMTDLFKHLDLELRMDEFYPTAVERSSGPTSAAKRSLSNVVQFTSPEGKPSQQIAKETQPKRRPAKKTTSPTVSSPLRGDFFMTGDTIHVKWENIDPSYTYINIMLYQADSLAPDVLVASFPNIPNSYGSYSLVVNSTWPAYTGYYIEIEYDCYYYCSTVDGENFAVNTYPEVIFSQPVRGAVVKAGDTLTISVQINVNSAGPFSLYVYEQIDYYPDPSMFTAIEFYSTNFTTNITIPNPLSGSWVPSNSYYVEVDWDCSFGWCSYQTSELFSVLDTGATNSLSFDLPSKGSAYQAGTPITVTMLGDFGYDANVTLTLMERRLGWDYEAYSSYLVYPANISQISTSVVVQADWTPSKSYYFTAQWGCSAGDCTGYAESEEFAVNYVPVLSVASLQKEYQLDQNLHLSWTALYRYQDLTISLCSSIPGPDYLTCSVLGSDIDTALQTYLDWNANDQEGSVYWDNYFYFEYDCTYGYLCQSTESTYFRIREEVDILDWNWDEVNNRVEQIDKVLFHEDCTSLKSNNSFCTMPENSQEPVCQLCNMDGFDSSFDLKCQNCYAKIGVTVNDLKLSISWFTVEQFISNLTINATSVLNLVAQFNMQYQTQYETQIGPDIPISGIQEFKVCGFSLSLGVYGSLSLVADFGVEGNINANVNTTAGAAYDVYYNSNTDEFITTSRGPYFAVTAFNMEMQATTTLKVAIVPEIKLNILTQQEVLFINAQPYVKLTLSGSYPPFPALASGSVPQNAALLHIYPEYCSVAHWLEFIVSSGVDWSGGSKWDSSSSLILSGTLIQEFPTASGCIWPAQHVTGSSGFPVHFSQSAWDSFHLQTGSFQVALNVDIAKSLGVPDSSISKVNFTYDSSTGDSVLNVYFSDTSSLNSDQLSQQLSSLVNDPSSAFYSPDRLVSKAATLPAPSPSPSPSASSSVSPSSPPSVSPSASPSKGPTMSMSPSSAPASASVTPSPSSSPLAIPSTSVSPSSLPSVSPTPSSSATPASASSSPSSGASLSPSPAVSSSPSIQPTSSPSPSGTAIFPSVSASVSSGYSPAATQSITPSSGPNVSSSSSPTAVGPQNTKSNNKTSYVLIGCIAGAAVVAIGATIAGVMMLVKKNSRKQPNSSLHYEL